MASEYTTIIRLDPFLQRFLKAQFTQEGNGPFCFPDKHDFNRRLIFLLRPCPKDYRTPDYGEWTFRIAIPLMDYKNVQVYNYLSENGQIIFSNSVRKYAYMLFHEELNSAVLEHGFTRSEAIDYLSEEFGFIADDYDRLLKEYQRWFNTEKVRRYRNRRKMKKEKV